MRVLFHLFNSSRCDQTIRELCWHARGFDVVCVDHGFQKAGRIADELSDLIVKERRQAPNELLLLIVHPGISAAEEISRMELNDPLVITGLCSADHLGLAELLGFKVLGRLLVFPASLPENGGDILQRFRDEIEVMIDALSEIESSTLSNLELRKERCMNFAIDFVDRYPDRGPWFRLRQALRAAALTGAEADAYEIVCVDHYNNNRKFLEAARRFDRDLQLTWMGKLTRIHHLDLAPRFSNARDVFANDASAAREAWMQRDAEVRRLLAGSFQFSVLRFAQCALQERGDFPVAEGVEELIDLLDAMREGLLGEGSDVFEILAAGMGELSCQITNLRDNWYFLE